MSKTDKTDPTHIRMWRNEIPREAVHDHTDGVCNLPQTLAEEEATFGGVRGRHDCYWSFVWAGVSTCGCPLCTQQFERRTERRAARHESRRELASALKQVRAGSSLLDY